VAGLPDPPEETTKYLDLEDDYDLTPEEHEAFAKIPDSEVLVEVLEEMADENEEVEVVRTKKKVNDVFDDLLESQDQVMEETKKTKDFEEVED
jgi:hypothetical protein